MRSVRRGRLVRFALSTGLINRYEIQSLATLFEDDVLPLHLDARFSEWADVSIVAALGTSPQHTRMRRVLINSVVTTQDAEGCSVLVWVSADYGHTFRVRAVRLSRAFRVTGN